LLGLPSSSLVTEEAVVLTATSPGERPSAWPGPVGLWLLPDAHEALGGRIGGSTTERRRAQKTGLAAEHRIAAGPARLDALCLLGPPAADGLVVERLRAVTAVPQLLPHTVASPDRVPTTVRQLAGLLATVPLYRVRFPLGLDRLPGHVASLVDRFLDGGPGQ
jgi:hypothetical protein